jgi:hypothetical protein
VNLVTIAVLSLSLSSLSLRHSPSFSSPWVVDDEREYEKAGRKLRRTWKKRRIWRWAKIKFLRNKMETMIKMKVIWKQNEEKWHLMNKERQRVGNHKDMVKEKETDKMGERKKMENSEAEMKKKTATTKRK